MKRKKPLKTKLTPQVGDVWRMRRDAKVRWISDGRGGVQAVLYGTVHLKTGKA